MTIEPKPSGNRFCNFYIKSKLNIFKLDQTGKEAAPEQKPTAPETEGAKTEGGNT